MSILLLYRDETKNLHTIMCLVCNKMTYKLKIFFWREIFRTLHSQVLVLPFDPYTYSVASFMQNYRV